VSYGLRIVATDGSLLISQDSQNLRLLGPFTCSASASPAATILEAFSTHKYTFTSNVQPPLVYVALPATTSNGNGAAIVGMTRSGSSYTVYVLAIGVTPSIYYADDFVGAVMPDHGMAVFDAGGIMVWSSEDAMNSADYIEWSSNRVSTFVPNTLSLSAYAIALATPVSGEAVAGYIGARETGILNANIVTGAFTAWQVYPVYSLYPGGGYIYAYPATIKVAGYITATPYTRNAVYDAGTAFSFSYNFYGNAAQPVQRGAFLAR
jgi:hypothetical protein